MIKKENDFIVNRGQETDDYTRVNQNKYKYFFVKNNLFFNEWIKKLKSFINYASEPVEIIARCFEIILKELYLNNKKIDIKNSSKIISGSNYDLIDDADDEIIKKYLYFELRKFKFYEIIKNNL